MGNPMKRRWHSLSGNPNMGNLDYKWHSLGLVHARAPKHGLVYGASRLGRLRLHNKIYGQDDWLRWWRAHPRKVPMPKRLIMGIASIKGRLIYGMGTFAHGSLQLYKTVYRHY